MRQITNGLLFFVKHSKPCRNGELSIDDKHIDNFLVPLLKYKTAGKYLLFQGIEEAVEDLQNLRGLFERLQNGSDQALISFNMPQKWIYNHRTKSPEPCEFKNLTVKDPKMISLVAKALLGIYQTDPEFREFIHNSEYNDYESFNRGVYEKEQRMKCIFMAAEYLSHTGLYKSHSRASTICGALFSTVGDVQSREQFYRVNANKAYTKVEDYWREYYRRELTKHFKLNRVYTELCQNELTFKFDT